MSVVRREARCRWSLVGAGVAAPCLLPAVIAAWPSGRIDMDPTRLRDLILGSVNQPYQGDVDSHGEVSLPNLPALGEVAGLLGGSTRIRAWYACAGLWRVAVLGQTGERDIYRTADGTYVWDFERNLTTLTIGEPSVRLLQASDLVPPELARRLLRGAGSGEPVTALAGRTVAGVVAAGLRLTPSDTATTIGRVDVWADPATGLPVQVEVAARRSESTIYTSRFLELEQHAPDAEVVTPSVPDTAGLSVTTAEDVAAAIGSLAPTNLPDTVAGRARLPNPAGLDVPGVAAYGAGLSAFVVLALPSRVGAQTMQSARDGGGTPVDYPNGEGYEARTPLLGALVIRSDGDRRTRRSFLLVGTVTPDLLRQAGAELLTLPRVPG